MERKQVKEEVLTQLQKQIVNINEQITSLTEDAQNDAKSSAGDKHETGLAMMHLEQEKLSAKLRDLLQFETIVLKLPEEKQTDKVTLGSIVKTSKGIFYVSIAIPALKFQNQTVVCISPSAPLMKLLLNKTSGEEITFNSITYKILEIY